MIRAKHCYSPIEKECLVLVFAVQKIRHYLMGQHIQVISRVNRLRLLMTRPSSLNCRLATWAILLSQSDMQFMPQKAIKRQAMANFLADHPILGNSKLYDDLPDEINEVNLITPSQKNKCGNYSLTEHQE